MTLLFFLNPLFYSSSPFIVSLIVLLNLAIAESFTFMATKTRQSAFAMKSQSAFVSLRQKTALFYSNGFIPDMNFEHWYQKISSDKLFSMSSMHREAHGKRPTYR